MIPFAVIDAPGWVLIGASVVVIIDRMTAFYRARDKDKADKEKADRDVAELARVQKRDDDKVKLDQESVMAVEQVRLRQAEAALAVEQVRLEQIKARKEVTAVKDTLVTHNAALSVQLVEVKHLVNGVKTELVDEVRKASFAQGVKSETDKGKS